MKITIELTDEDHQKLTELITKHNSPDTWTPEKEAWFLLHAAIYDKYEHLKFIEQLTQQVKEIEERNAKNQSSITTQPQL